MLALLASVGETVQTGAGDGAAASSLRCLDPSHGDVCTRCALGPQPRGGPKTQSTHSVPHTGGCRGAP